MESLRHRRLWWAALTLPLPLAALAVYVLFEWLFFVTKPSVLSALTWADRFVVLGETPVPFLPFVLAMQGVATIAGAAAFRRLRGVAVVPAGLLAGCLGLLLVDNFTHVLFGVSSTNAGVRLRYVYAGLLLVLVAAACHWLFRLLDSGSPLRKAVVIVLIAAPSFALFAISEAKRPRVGNLFSSAPAAARNRNLPNVLILTNDSVESRYLSAYGFPRPTTPFLDSLRGETLFCENAFANACRTYGSLVTVLTGKLPTRTHVLDPPSIVYGDARYEHLPGILRRHGYRTLQLSTKLHGDAATANLVGAFDLANYDWEMLRLQRVDRATDTARVFRLQVFDRLQDRLARIFAGEDKDTFAFVMGTRSPTFWSDERRIRTLLRFMSETRQPWLAHVHLLDTHLGKDPALAVRGADEWMRKVVEALRKSGQLEHTIIVIGSDHGRWWQTRERVPLMFRFPNGQHARREAQNAQTADIAPTILDALGLPVPGWMDGQSLLRPLPENRRIVALCGAAGNEQASKLREPNFGTASAMIVVGSWWYEMQIADGTMRGGAVNGHTVPMPPAPPAAARAELEQKLRAAGFRLP
ncbi:MAG TPA: sulfatase-like hydrolase/transferase [Thermoanaerobaculia bacterium]